MPSALQIVVLAHASISPPLQGPCDILGAAGNPCAAAHSTVRALYAKYSGPLYTVFHTQSNKSADVSTLKPGGFADVIQHETICPKEGECTISRVIDQSGKGNHLTPRDERGVPSHPPSGVTPKFGHLHNPVDASKHKIYVGGDNTHVYGMYFDHGMGYKNNRTKGVATGDGERAVYMRIQSSIPSHSYRFAHSDTETMYAVMTGKRWGNGCCFDYGT
jgi:hypothetical protein